MTTKQLLFLTLILGAVANITLTMETNTIEQQKKLNKEFLTAALRGNSHTVKQLLKNGIDINTKHEDGSTALHYAAGQKNERLLFTGIGLMLESEYYDIAAELVRKKGMDIDAQNSLGNTAAHYAANNCDCGILYLIYKNRGNLNLENKDNKTPLQIVQHKVQKYKEFLNTETLTDKEKQNIKNNGFLLYERCKKTEEFLQKKINKNKNNRS